MSFHLIGCGPGSPVYLPRAARDLARRCDCLVGRPAEHALFNRIERKRETFEVWETDCLERLARKGAGADHSWGLLVPGDATSSPIERKLREICPDLLGTVIPGISPLALACARVGLSFAQVIQLSTVLGIDAQLAEVVCRARYPGVCVTGHVTVSELADCLFRNRCPNRRSVVFRGIGTRAEHRVDLDLFGLLEQEQAGDALVLFPEEEGRTPEPSAAIPVAERPLMN